MRYAVPIIALTLALTACSTESGTTSADPAPAGTNRPATTSAPPDTATFTPTPTTATATATAEPTPTATATATATSTPTPTPTEEPTPTTPTYSTFGDTFTYENDLSITIGEPEPFTPSDTAAFDEAAAYVSFPVTIVNNSTEPYDPTLFFVNGQSTNTEIDQVFDSAQGYEGSPSTVLLPGREASFNLGFGVADPDDIVLEVSPGFEYDNAIFTS